MTASEFIDKFLESTKDSGSNIAVNEPLLKALVGSKIFMTQFVPEMAAHVIHSALTGKVPDLFAAFAMFADIGYQVAKFEETPEAKEAVSAGTVN